MRPDWTAILAFLAACSGLAGFGAYTGSDREAGRLLMVVGVIVGLLVMALALPRFL